MLLPWPSTLLLHLAAAGRILLLLLLQHLLLLRLLLLHPLLLLHGHLLLRGHRPALHAFTSTTRIGWTGLVWANKKW